MIKHYGAVALNVEECLLKNYIILKSFQTIFIYVISSAITFEIIIIPILQMKTWSLRKIKLLIQGS